MESTSVNGRTIPNNMPENKILENERRTCMLLNVAVLVESVIFMCIKNT
jgi:hypothetical protein